MEQGSHAVIATGGKQYLVTPGQVVRVEKLPGDAGTSVSFTDVLLAVNGTTVKIGRPMLSGASVTATIVRQGRADKVTGVRFKPKKRQHAKFGHRQHFTEVRIDAVTGVG